MEEMGIQIQGARIVQRAIRGVGDRILKFMGEVQGRERWLSDWPMQAFLREAG